VIAFKFDDLGVDVFLDVEEVVFEGLEIIDPQIVFQVIFRIFV